MTAALSAPSSGKSLRSSKRCVAALRPKAVVPRGSAGRRVDVTTRAAVEVSVAYAVAQQDLFFAATVAGECLYQQGNLPTDFKGRPEFQNIILPCGLLVGVRRF